MPNRRRAESPRPERMAAAAVLVLGGVFIWRSRFTVHGHWSYTLFDDSMVSMRYAHNLARGDGLVWNAGQPGVEGYSNFLWTLWMAVLHLTGLPGEVVSLLVSGSGLAIMVALALLAARVAGRLAPDRPSARAVAAWSVVLCYPVLFWTLRGMEVGAAALVLLAAVDAALGADDRNERRTLAMLAGCAIAGVLLRTDLLLPLALIAAAGWFIWPTPRRLPRAAALAGAAVGALVVHSWLRFRWYGSIVPTTYTLKVGGTSVLDRLPRGGWAVTLTLVTLVPLLVFIGLAIGDRDRRRRVAVVLVPAAGVLAYCVYVGGDVWEYFVFADRFVATVLPLIVVGASVGVATLADAEWDPRVRTTLLVAGGSLIVAALLLAGELLPIEPSLWQALSGDDGEVRTVVVLVLGAVMVATAGYGRRRPRAAGALATAAVVIGMSGVGLASFATSGVQWLDNDAAQAESGMTLARVLPPGTTVAVVQAGSLPYFWDGPAIDLLGKSDAVVAATAPHPEAFVPGHNKRDYGYSIGVLHPEVVVALWRPTEDDIARMTAMGYATWNGIWYDPTRISLDDLRSAPSHR